MKKKRIKEYYHDSFGNIYSKEMMWPYACKTLHVSEVVAILNESEMVLDRIKKTSGRLFFFVVATGIVSVVAILILTFKTI